MTTLCQWRAYEACFVRGLTQAQAAILFGISQAAISRRIHRYLLARGERRQAAGRRRLVTVVSLNPET